MWDCHSLSTFFDFDIPIICHPLHVLLFFLSFFMISTNPLMHLLEATITEPLIITTNEHGCLGRRLSSGTQV